MRLPLLPTRPPTLLERFVGRRRARLIRRRVGLAAVGFGLATLRPRPRRRGAGVALVIVVAGFGIVLATIAPPIR